MAEEVGLAIAVVDMLGIYMGTDDDRREPEPILNIVFIAQSKEEKVFLGSDETQATRWFEIDELPKSLAFEHNNNAIRDWRLQGHG